MKKLLAFLAIVSLPFAVQAAENQPIWAFSFPDKDQPQRPPEADGPKQVPGSSKTYTQKQIDDLKNPPDWFPDEHAPMPDVVAHGGPGLVFACAACHLASGMGHPESAPLAGLPANYMERQLADFKNGARANPIIVDGKPQMNAVQYMVVIAQGLSDADTKAASEWFAALKPQPKWVKVVEAANAPKSYISRGYMRVALPDGGVEPIGNRIIELPQEESRQVLRDPHSGTVAYVPPGSVKTGKALVTEGGKAPKCGTCHGPDLNGAGDVPAITGRSPTYLFRQLYDFKNGSRGGASAALMKNVVANLTESDMVAVAAYLASPAH